MNKNWDAIYVAGSRIVQHGPCKLIFKTTLLFPAASWTVKRITSLLFPAASFTRIVFILLLRTRCWVWSLFRASFLVPPDTDSESSCGFLGTEECCFTFCKFLEIRPVDLGFATASSSPVFLSWFLFDMEFAFFNWAKMAAREQKKFHDVNYNRRRRLHH